MMHGGGQSAGSARHAQRAGHRRVRQGRRDLRAGARAESARLAALRDRLLAGLRQRIPDVRVNGSLDHRLPHNLNVSFPGIEAGAAGIAIDDVAVSSARRARPARPSRRTCSRRSASTPSWPFASVRFGLGRWTTEEEIDYAIDKIATVVGRLREMRAALGT